MHGETTDFGDLVKLIDFGFARVPLEKFEGSDDTMSITTMGEVFGTIGFIAPEAAFGMKSVTEKADLYALGVTFYEMVAGKHPFDRVSDKQLFRAHSLEFLDCFLSLTVLRGLTPLCSSPQFTLLFGFG